MSALAVYIILFPNLFLTILVLLVRLENEHIGNIDQYRVTREVPLPYTVRVDENDDVDTLGDKSGRNSLVSFLLL